jgi:hypothetical protein
MVRAISDDSQLLEFLGRLVKFLSGRATHSGQAMVVERPEFAFRHRRPIVSETNPTISPTGDKWLV